MEVLFVVPGNRRIASTRLRILNALPYLDSAGIDHEVVSLQNTVSTFPGNLPGKAAFGLKLVSSAPRFDVVYVHRILLPPLFTKYLSALPGEFVYDFDDALYAAPHWRDVDPERESRLQAILRQASLVVAGSPMLAEYAEPHSDRTVCLPTALPEHDYRETADVGDSDRVTIGWIGNSQNLHYLSEIEEPLVRVLDDHDDAELIVITSPESECPVIPFADRRGDDVHYLEWSLDDEIDYLRRADIVVRPLRDDPWCRGKGGFTSVVQAMALGIPVVVTPVSMLEDLVTPGENGFHASTDEDWVTHLDHLVSTPEERTAMGRRAREVVSEEGFWTADRAEELVSTLRSLE